MDMKEELKAAAVHQYHWSSLDSITQQNVIIQPFSQMYYQSYYTQHWHQILNNDASLKLRGGGLGFNTGLGLSTP